ncbi:YaeQ family protein [Leucobacter insecticola]|uniref:YaeQ family protein n=1 Tax=Leucobacter insecticola TaxID=2714934 RepID=A0A6G8FKK0_9MICO|nr:YaeQ family protein [Leucobacter insecticola]QIM16884.1 YaeQ family protein [Leucobacter insecticola]
MAIGSTMVTFAVQLADVDRGVYDEFTLRLAQHPSETAEFMVTRLLAYCLEYEEGITFGGGVSTTDEPAVFVKDLTGKMTAWIEVGAPDAARVHAGSKAADRAAVYTHRDPAKLLASWTGKPLHRADELVVRSFDIAFVRDVASRLERRNDLSVSVTEGQLYLELNGASLTATVEEHRAA